MTTTTEHVPAGTVLQVDPGTLVLDDNIRADAQLDDVFVASIEANGVMVPLQVRQDPLGQLLIIDGQRRYLAATRTAQATVPVIVVAGIGDDGDRITNQWILNEHRSALTTAERAAAVEQLSLFGRSPAAIAKKLGATREEVDAALVVAEAPQMLQALGAEPTLDLVTAAKLAEFADDAEALEELAEAAKDAPDYFEHALQRARQNRAVEQARAAKVAELEADGVRVVTMVDGDASGIGTKVSELSASPYVDTQPPALTAEEHATCPHRAFLVQAWWWNGLNTKEPTTDVEERCLDREAAGHHLRFVKEGSAADLDEEAAAAAKSAERKHVRDQNAASDAAQEVRRRFIVDQLLWERDPKGRMTKVPDGAVQHVAAVIEANAAAVSGYEAGNLLSEWAKGKTTPPPGSSRPVAERALLRRVLAAGEACLPRDFWRQVPKPYFYDDGAPVTVQHLRQLEAWGYGLAPVEREYLTAWDAAVTARAEAREAEAARAAGRAERDAETVTP